MTKPLLRKMQPEDYPAMQAIYQEGILTKNATFQKEIMAFEEWDHKYLSTCRLVAVLEKEVVGFAALLPFSSMESYRGVAEVSIYISSKARGNGIGSLLMQQLIEASEEEGYWTLQSLIFPENVASISLHHKAGFELRARHPRLGEMDGIFRDVLLLERRSQTVGLDR